MGANKKIKQKMCSPKVIAQYVKKPLPPLPIVKEKKECKGSKIEIAEDKVQAEEKVFL